MGTGISYAPEAAAELTVGLAQTLCPKPRAAGTHLLFADVVISQNYTVTCISIACQEKKNETIKMEIIALKIKTFLKYVSHFTQPNFPQYSSTQEK